MVRNDGNRTERHVERSLPLFENDCEMARKKMGNATVAESIGRVTPCAPGTHLGRSFLVNTSISQIDSSPESSILEKSQSKLDLQDQGRISISYRTTKK